MLGHIVAGSLGLVSGAFAAFSRKGSPLHRAAGTVFLVSMLTMAISGGIISALMGKQVPVLAAATTFYLVLSGWLLGRHASIGSRAPRAVSFALALLVTSYGVYLGVEALDGRTDILPDGFVVPPAVYFIFAGMAGLGALFNLWALARGGFRGTTRIVQHLWRMLAALYIACGSFFNGQADVFPEAIRKSAILELPSLLVIGLLLFWVAKFTLIRWLLHLRRAAV